MVVDPGMVVRMDEIAVSKFQATCLAALNRVRRTGRPLRVTRFGKPLADVVPPQAAPSQDGWLSAMQGRGRVTGDLVTPIAGADDWDALR
jgi:antitoxin (DNA-binding transcriptional repressor) of toxin-antitoxin stability system